MGWHPSFAGEDSLDSSLLPYYPEIAFAGHRNGIWAVAELSIHVRWTIFFSYLILIALVSLRFLV